MARKPPRRTAERILATSLELFNRFGEPNASTSMIAADLNISPGNLYYHFPSKDELINTLFDQYELALEKLLAAAEDVHDVEDAWFFLHTLLELIWDYRFLYRDLNHLLSRNIYLERRIPPLLAAKREALAAIVEQLNQSDDETEQAGQRQAVSGSAAATMVVLLTYWLSYEYALQPRQALEPQNAQNALLRGAWHVMELLATHVRGPAQAHLLELLEAYRAAALES